MPRRKKTPEIIPPARIELSVDGNQISIWEWARVRHAINWYSSSEYQKVLRGEAQVTDGSGERVDLDGALEADIQLEIRPVTRGGAPRPAVAPLAPAPTKSGPPPRPGTTRSREVGRPTH